jgi:anaerobic ribonucleoside-triphosphate reductase activating protein
VTTLRIARFVPVTTAEGPGERFALWVQGCSLRCPGCCNPEMFEPAGGTAWEVRALLAEVRAPGDAIEGVTLLGGEPFDQAGALAELAEGCHALGLSVMTFTGYTLAELRAREDEDTEALVAATDLLVDGRYDATRPETARRWAGSTNQTFHFLTGRYPPGIERGAERVVEARLRLDGTAEVNGWPELAGLAKKLSDS